MMERAYRFPFFSSYLDPGVIVDVFIIIGFQAPKKVVVLLLVFTFYIRDAIVHINFNQVPPF
jgi:hypothetical protein